LVLIDEKFTLERNKVACCEHSGHGNVEHIAFIIENSCGPTSLNFSSFIFSARLWNSIQMGGPQLFGDILYVLNIINIKTYREIKDIDGKI